MRRSGDRRQMMPAGILQHIWVCPVKIRNAGEIRKDRRRIELSSWAKLCSDVPSKIKANHIQLDTIVKERHLCPAIRRLWFPALARL